ncbi:MAG TPA: cupin domain-containing protein [Dongiaceae bacterium]|nr:cupin domain-containing protein [Dongiaceae bacterium]
MTATAERAASWFDAIEPAFFEEHFDRKPYFARGFFRGDLGGVLSLRDLDYLFVSSPGARHSYLRASRMTADGRKDEHRLDPETKLARIARYYRDGYTIALDEVNYRCPPVYRMCGELQEAFARRGFANVRSRPTCGLFLTPRTSQGFPVHYDCKDVFALQIAGRKTWALYEPTTPAPTRNSEDDAFLGADLGEPVLQVTMEPGDLLYFPRGYLHRPFTDDAFSLHLSFALTTLTWADVFAQMMQASAAFRATVPHEFWANGEIAPELRTALGALVAPLADADAVRRKLHAWSAGDLVAENQVAGDVIADAVAAELRGADAVPEERFAKRYGARLRLGRDGNEVVVTFPGNLVRLPGAYAAAVQRIVAAETFTIDEVAGELPPGDARALCTRLFDSGFLRAAPR